MQEPPWSRRPRAWRHRAQGILQLVRCHHEHRRPPRASRSHWRARSVDRFPLTIRALTGGRLSQQEVADEHRVDGALHQRLGQQRELPFVAQSFDRNRAHPQRDLEVPDTMSRLAEEICAATIQRGFTAGLVDEGGDLTPVIERIGDCDRGEPSGSRRRLSEFLHGRNDATPRYPGPCRRTSERIAAAFSNAIARSISPARPAPRARSTRCNTREGSPCIGPDAS